MKLHFIDEHQPAFDKAHKEFADFVVCRFHAQNFVIQNLGKVTS